ncbi:hypothetical protein J2Y48_003416 [Mycoplana sp. BE70]|uniref:potassium channel family protein n=1 Tax=Mycoplana sp. BE70 TaxID=2817775 RepID=UPI002861BA98|nr:potassium channel family protein [Mycoplana sp. BE70]MDR6758118.1 hypothetical protein [Mycoplana sp. BE70]
MAAESGHRSHPKEMRRHFFIELFRYVHVLWPIFSGILVVMVGSGMIAGLIEGWRIEDTLYFTFVTGLTIGYGDITPKHLAARLLAILIGFAGILLTGLVASVAVHALQAIRSDRLDR